jgi:glycerol-3-phosphate acyltransferase PlsY
MIIAIVLAYLIGSIPFAFLFARWWGSADLREVGSGNLGAANVVRTSGVAAGVVVALLDMSKGAASVVLARRLGAPVGGCAAAGFASIIGHIYPVWLRFRGGKGVATACGAFLVLTPLAGLVTVVLFTLSVWITRYVSVGSVLASAVLPPIAYATGSPRVVVAFACAAAAVIIFKHRSNLLRLRTGIERRLLLS